MGKQWKQCQTLFWGGSKITADGDCSHEIKRCLFLGRKVVTNLDSILKSRNITSPTKVYLVKAMVFPVVMYGCESEWTLGVGDGQGGLVCCSPWGCKESDTTEPPNWNELIRDMCAHNLNVTWVFFHIQLLIIITEYLLSNYCTLDKIFVFSIQIKFLRFIHAALCMSHPLLLSIDPALLLSVIYEWVNYLN